MNPRPFPADGFTARWTTWAGDHADELELRWDNEAWTARGRVSRGGVDDVEYVLRLSPLWQARQFLLFRDLDQPDLWLGTDGAGRWGEVNGAHRPDLDGAHDIELSVTPFTLTLPIRRLPLTVGDGADLTVLAVEVDTLGVTPVGRRYERVGERRWRVDGTEFDVDHHALPLDITDRFHRTA